MVLLGNILTHQSKNRAKNETLPKKNIVELFGYRLKLLTIELLISSQSKLQVFAIILVFNL